jgi:putative tricarboxylic transport membrane protein
MALYEKVLSFIWLFLGVALCWMSYRVGLGDVGSPGSGFIPFLTGCLLVFLASLHLIHTFFFLTNPHRRKGFWEGVRWDKLVLVVAALLAYIFLLPVMGYFIVTFLFLVFLGKILEPQSWRTLLIISTLSVALSYLVFGYWLKCQFPMGYLLDSGFF